MRTIIIIMLTDFTSHFSMMSIYYMWIAAFIIIIILVVVITYIFEQKQQTTRSNDNYNKIRWYTKIQLRSSSPSSSFKLETERERVYYSVKKIAESVYCSSQKAVKNVYNSHDDDEDNGALTNNQQCIIFTFTFFYTWATFSSSFTCVAAASSSWATINMISCELWSEEEAS